MPLSLRAESRDESTAGAEIFSFGNTVHLELHKACLELFHPSLTSIRIRMPEGPLP